MGPGQFCLGEAVDPPGPDLELFATAHFVSGILCEYYGVKDREKMIAATSEAKPHFQNDRIREAFARLDELKLLPS